VLQIRETIDADHYGRRRSSPQHAMNIKRLMDLRLLSRPAPSQGPAGSRPAHAHQCPHPQGQGQAIAGKKK
jgi:hypothetical protein